MGESRIVLVCSCEDTMPLDCEVLRRGCRDVEIATAHQLCRTELDRLRRLLGPEAQLTIGCTQEAPLFRDVAAESGADLRFVNLRESAGWSDEAAQAGPKMAALLAAAAVEVPEASFVPLESAGVVLVYGRDERAVEA
jgi:hypothetical protein